MRCTQATTPWLRTRQRRSVPRPAACPAPGARLFGPAVQLYAVRSRRNWGIGDFTDLANVARYSASQGASFIGVNPLHELFLDRPEQASPYSPSSRLALNPMYLDVEAIPEFRESAQAQALVASEPLRARIAALRAAPLVDYVGVWSAKRQVLGLLFHRFRDGELRPMTDRGRAFRDFAQGAGRRTCRCCDLRRDPVEARRGRSTRYGDGRVACGSIAIVRIRSVAAFAQRESEDVDFYLYLQWQADAQLGVAQQAALDAGMSIGLYRDLAVGANPGGAETWQQPRLFATGVHVGAPPDDFNRTGQDWGLPPWIPHVLRRTAFEAWKALLAPTCATAAPFGSTT